MGRREIPEINAGSMADIAFLLLIFFLVTTTISVPEAGQPQKLPYKIKIELPDQDVKILDQNVLFVKANKNDNLLLDKKEIIARDQVAELYEITRNFYGTHEKNRPIDEDGDGKPDYPVREEVTLGGIEKEIEDAQTLLESYEERGEDTKYAKAMLKRAKTKKKVFLEVGKYYELPKMCLIKFESDNGTSYGFYLEVLDQMKSALMDLRNEYSQANWGVNYDELDEETDADKIDIVDNLYPNKIIDSSDKD